MNINGFCRQNESENDSIRYNYEDSQEDSLFYKNDKGQLIEKQSNQVANGYFKKEDHPLIYQVNLSMDI